MKTERNFVTFYLSVGLFASVPSISLTDINIVPQDIATAPTIPTTALQQLTWMPVDQSEAQSTQLANTDQRLDVAGITSSVVAYSVPASIGGLTLILSSGVNKRTSIFAPNVLVLGRNITSSTLFPSSYFTYQKPGVMSADRLEGVMRLTSTLGQQKLYVLVFITDKNPQQTTALLDPAKAYTKRVGNAAPDIPDPIARRTTDGLLKLRVKTNSSSNVLVGPLFGPSSPGPVTVGNIAAPAVAYAASAIAVAALAP